MADPLSDKPSAVRKRRLRQRRREGAIIAPAEVDAELIDAMVAAGLLLVEDRDHRTTIADALVDLARQALEALGYMSTRTGGVPD
jgi:hypothetical protein